VFLLAVAVARKGLRSTLPLVLVLVLAVAGEMLDVRDELRHDRPLQIGASLHDIVNTMFWPLALWLLGRYSRVIG
jgi:hypothetical protein